MHLAGSNLWLREIWREEGKTCMSDPWESPRTAVPLVGIPRRLLLLWLRDVCYIRKMGTRTID